VTVLAVIAPLYPAADYRTSAALTYQRGAALPTGDYGEVQVDGVYWTPIYERAPLNAAQFGVIGDGAVDGATGTVTGTDNAPMLQAAIDYALQHGLNTVKIPDGAYRLDETIHLGYTSFNSLALIGSATRAYTASLAGVRLLPTKTDRPCINVQGARFTRISGISITGQNRVWAQHQRWWVNSLSPNETDWLDPGLVPPSISPGGLQQHAPYAAITIDAFSDPKPIDHYPSVNYPAWLGTGIAQYNKPYSSEINIDQVDILGFAVGVCLKPNGDYNGDFLRVRTSSFESCVYAIAVCHPQSRNVHIEDVTYVGCHTFLTNSRFGLQAGKLGGPITNVSGGASYQTLSLLAGGYTGPVVLANCYFENQVRIGAVGRGVVRSFNDSITFDACQFDLSESLHGQIARAALDTDANQHVTFRNTSIRNTSRIGNLVWGGASVSIEGGMFVSNSSYLLSTTDKAAHTAALNYTGGILLGSNDVLAPVLNLQFPLDWHGVTRGVYVDPKTYAVSSQGLCADVQFGSKDRAPLTQASIGFLDTQAKRWRFAMKPNNWLVSMTNPAQVTVSPAFSADVMTFTYSAVYQTTHQPLALGDILYHQPSGTIFVVTTIGAPIGGGDYPIAAVQTNNMTVNPSTGVFISNGLTDLALSGYCIIIQTQVVIPRQVVYGDFTSGSGNVTNVHRGDGYANDLATWLAANDQLFGYTYNDASLGWPMAKLAKINAVTPGTYPITGSIVLSANAVQTGRAPVFPIPIR